MAIETPPLRHHRQAHEATEAAVVAAIERAGSGHAGTKRKAQEEAAVEGLVALAREPEDAHA